MLINASVAPNEYAPTRYVNLGNSRSAFAGLFVDLPMGVFEVNFSQWISVTDANANNTYPNKFALSFSSKSSTDNTLTPMCLGTRSIVFGPTYNSPFIDYYGSGKILVEITQADVDTYGAYEANPVGGDPKEAGMVRLYLWTALSVHTFNTNTLRDSQTYRSRTMSTGSFGPYSQIYAIPLGK